MHLEQAQAIFDQAVELFAGDVVSTKDRRYCQQVNFHGWGDSVIKLSMLLNGPGTYFHLAGPWTGRPNTNPYTVIYKDAPKANEELTENPRQVKVLAPAAELGQIILADVATAKKNARGFFQSRVSSI